MSRLLPHSSGNKNNSQFVRKLPKNALGPSNIGSNGVKVSMKRSYSDEILPRHQRFTHTDENAPLLGHNDPYQAAGISTLCFQTIPSAFSALQHNTRLSDGFCGRKAQKALALVKSYTRKILLSFRSSVFPTIQNPCQHPFRESNNMRDEVTSGIHDSLGPAWRNLSVVLQSGVESPNDTRLWYDQFTSVDWIHDAVADSFRTKDLLKKSGLRGHILLWMDAVQDPILASIIGFFTAWIAYIVAVSDRALSDLKLGHCAHGWLVSRSVCCGGPHLSSCDQWITWSKTIGIQYFRSETFDFLAYLFFMVFFALFSSLLALQSGITTCRRLESNSEFTGGRKDSAHFCPSKILYSATGSGVAEVRIILSGFVLHGFLSPRTLIIKSMSLILSISSGLCIGKEGPLVHIATCIGDLVSRISAKYRHNEGKLRELLSGAAGSGVAVAFGAPISGVLFSLEEVSYYFPAQTLFQTFLCCLTAALSLKFFDPYGDHRIVLFQVDYKNEWHNLDLPIFMLLGVLGGAIGALFVKASRIWAQTFRKISVIQGFPLLEVVLISLISGLLSFKNRYTSLPVNELLLELTSPCNSRQERGTGLCPTKEQIPDVIGHLLAALVIKSILTTITFGIKMPAGIYIPSMIVGGLTGRVIGHTVQHLAQQYPQFLLFSECSGNENIQACAIPGVYALLTAGATMCGVTRLTITLATILFELTGNLDYVLPFSVTIFVAKWTANTIEPLSIYDLLTHTNHYPFLDNKIRPNLTAELQEIAPPVQKDRIIDISQSVLIHVDNLRDKLSFLQSRNEFDGGLPIVKDKILVGLISCSDLEFALDLINEHDTEFCLVSPQEDTKIQIQIVNFFDLNPFIDPAPVALDAHSSLELVYECFVKLGLRYICVLQGGHFAGVVHKKTFVKYIHDVEGMP